MGRFTLSKYSVKSSTTQRTIRGITLNFGPQHPAAHGILRLTLQMSGEVILRLDPQFGLLHRGTEKLMESRSYLQSLPYFDRFDYVANLFQEHVFCLAVESLCVAGQGVNLSLSLVRTMFDELSRILNHLLTLSAVSMDIGAMGPIFWAFEEREYIMELFERVSGARMHTALYKPFSIDWTGLTSVFFLDLARFLTRAGRSLAGAFLGLLNNRIFKTRLGGVGSFSWEKLQAYGITGIIARSTGLKKDLRLQKNQAYGAYWYLNFRTFLGRKGDNLDRFLIRIKETVESFRLLSQCLAALSVTKRKDDSVASLYSHVKHVIIVWTAKTISFFYITAGVLNKVSKPFKLPRVGLVACSLWPQFSKGKFVGMENLISHFRQMTEGLQVNSGFTYKAVESPKGEVGVSLISDGTSRPYRIKVRTPVAHNMHLIPSIAEGVTFADFVATFCSLDIVLGEIDR